MKTIALNREAMDVGAEESESMGGEDEWIGLG